MYAIILAKKGKDLYMDNFKYNNIIKEINYNKDLNYKNNIEYKYNIYKNADSFSDLMKSIQLARRVQQQQQTQAQAQQQTPTQTPSLTSRTATTCWSPMSIAGTVYKFNRGVIGIDYEGEIHEIILDRTTRHHNDATAEIGTLTNCPVSDKYAGPFENGLEVSEQGTLIIQLEGDSMLVYLPKEMTTEQYNKLVSEVTPRSNFTVSFTHDGQIYDDNNVTASALLSFSQNLTASTRRVSR